ncbi:MAG: repressor LexA [Chloroflexi bacterium HGW-Chloroflexi-1]|nr:MAG: repressor LexA [Chloroflexi bacterium HGW-Chloroflexi-1]
MTLSERQERILVFIRNYLEEHRYPPTIREIGKAVGINSTSVVKYNLERLQEKEYIVRSVEVSRGLRLKDGPSLVPQSLRALLSQLVPVPKYGVISAGTPIAAVGQQDNPFAGETLALTQDLVPKASGVYALQVKGDSMIDALVTDGDWVIIQHQTTAQARDMVVAWIKDREETTLKYYFPEGRRVRLQPANPAYEPIYVPASQLEIQGKVVAVVRQLV